MQCFWVLMNVIIIMLIYSLSEESLGKLQFPNKNSLTLTEFGPGYILQIYMYIILLISLEIFFVLLVFIILLYRLGLD